MTYNPVIIKSQNIIYAFQSLLKEVLIISTVTAGYPYSIADLNIVFLPQTTQKKSSTGNRYEIDFDVFVYATDFIEGFAYSSAIAEILIMREDLKSYENIKFERAVGNPGQYLGITEELGKHQYLHKIEIKTTYKITEV